MTILDSSSNVADADAVSRPRDQAKQHVNRYSICVILFITLSSAAYGYAGSIIATTLTQPSFFEYFELETRPDASTIIGLMNALYYVGGIIGSFTSGWSCNRFGRKITVICGNILILLSGALLAGSVHIGMFLAFRVMSGCGSFIILSSVPVWVAELSPPKIRGILTDIHAVFMMLGYTIACYCGLAFYFVEGNNQWRGALSIQTVLPVIILCGIRWMPESPRYLISKDRIEEARKIIFRMHSHPSDPEGLFAKWEFYQIRKQIELDKTFATSYVDIFKQPSMRKRALITVFLEFCLMSSGILVILNYGSIIWKSLGFNTVQILNFQCGFQLTGLVFNVVAMSFVDKIKRPHLIAGGFFATALVMAGETALQRFYLGSGERGGLIACATLILLFQVSYSLFLDGPTFFYVAEIWPSHVRSQGFAIAMATMSVTNLMWLQAAPTAFNSIGWRFYLFFICIPVVGSGIVLLFFKDTLHKPLEEIAAIFGDQDMVAVYQQELEQGHIPVDELDSEDMEKQRIEISGTVETVETA
ncbi:MFS general substrate transporter [Thozetella sp. PMI_491]|nr:MFS general substrate transporter [Thozetella sp. PMI_491]